MTKAPWPTDYIPGSAGKIAVMAERVSQGYDSDHPEDIGLDASPAPVALHTARIDDILANLTQLAQESDIGST